MACTGVQLRQPAAESDQEETCNLCAERNRPLNSLFARLRDWVIQLVDRLVSDWAEVTHLCPRLSAAAIAATHRSLLPHVVTGAGILVQVGALRCCVDAAREAAVRAQHSGAYLV